MSDEFKRDEGHDCPMSTPSAPVPGAQPAPAAADVIPAQPAGAAEFRGHLFRLVEAGAGQVDLSSFAAALDRYVEAVTAIDTQVLEEADRECDEHVAAGRVFMQAAEDAQAWGRQESDRASRYRARLDRVVSECETLMTQVSGLSPSALAGRREAVIRIREAARPVGSRSGVAHQLRLPDPIEEPK
ncbi:hypothetical protein ACFYPC_33675 [Streptomyces sp. NPDC005808]|uniref:hypothetical protein n=1 Tax=Streptomyces sp. NPDC005808 TaxID=3364734 RepID=UPI0036C4025C